MAALTALGLLDTPPEAGFDSVTAFICQALDVPTSLVSLVDRDRQWFKSANGFDQPETGLESSVCAYVVLEDDLVEIEDLTADPRTAQNPLVTQEGGIRFYAGAPLRLSDGQVMGALCAIDTKPRHLTDLQRQTLRVLADQVVTQMELKQALADAETLRKEIDHRVKNSLQSISALTRIQARKAEEPAVRDALKQVQARVEMVAALHEQLYRSSATHSVDLADFAGKVGSILNGTSPPEIEVQVTFARVEVEPEQASAIGVILNEFASNSIKHAFPEGRPGVVRFEGALRDGSLVIDLMDDGIGMGPISHTSGIGLAVIEASVAQLGGAWEPIIDRTGTAARLTIPL
ncbi:MAG: histidine kinase dimerization/phosphoacceptor domain -containing protein [Pseudomonadota bacterium]|nr:histidine kinase dimerization/phosphoacceptor domain -containing protein [Pseudomonadota bacterium]